MISVREDGSVVFEFDNLRQRTSDAGVKKPVQVLAPRDKLLQSQVSCANIGRIAGNSGKRTKELLGSVDEE